MEDNLVISSLVVRVLPERAEEVVRALSQFEGVEVHELVDTKVVVTIEAASVAESHDKADSFHGIPGVVGVDLVYVNFEDDPSLKRSAAR